MQRHTKEAASWVMGNGVQYYKEEGYQAFKKYLRDKWYVSSTFAMTDEHGYLARFDLSGGGMFYDIQCLKRVKKRGSIYEYWIFNARGDDLGEPAHAEFYITKANSVDGEREVLHSSLQFFDSYTVDGVEIKLPLNDLKLLCDMQAWQYPESYKGHEIAHLEVQDSPNGYFIVSDSFFGKVGHMFRNVIGPDRSRYRKLK